MSHCPVPPRDLDPGWRTEAAERFYSSLGDDIRVGFGDEDSFDDGIESLLYDLNQAGYETSSSNLACSGSWQSSGPNLYFKDGARSHPEEKIAEAVDPPEGWYIDTGHENGKAYFDLRHRGQQHNGMHDDLREECGYLREGPGVNGMTDEYRECLSDFWEDVNPIEDYGYPTPEERVAADRAFFEGVRRGLGIND